MNIEINDEERDLLLMVLHNEMCPDDHGYDPDTVHARECNEMYKKISGHDCDEWKHLVYKNSGTPTP